MDCFRVKVPEGRTLHGRTATGQLVPVYPGDYLVHRLRPKDAATARPILRWVGADAAGRDVHMPWDGPLPEDIRDADAAAWPRQRLRVRNDDSFEQNHDDPTRSSAIAR